MRTILEGPVKTLRDKVRAEALNRPGVYRMVGSTGAVIYVGKSKRVRTRLMGYFRARKDEKAWRIVREASAVEWDYVPSEFASLLRELELIKRYRPPHNVRQKREAIYAFIKLTGGPAPKLSVVRRTTDQAATYFGPFRGSQRLADGVHEINDVLRLRDCHQGTPIHFSDQVDLFQVDRSPLCARFELDRCVGPCAGLCSAQDYARRIEHARAFLLGQGHEPLLELDRRMKNAADKWEFEYAAGLRERATRLQNLREELARLRESLERLTFLYVVPGAEEEHRVYAIRSGSVRGTYPAPKTRHQREKLVRSIAEIYRNPESPREVTSRERVEQILLVAHWFRTKSVEMARTYSKARWHELPLASELNDENQA